MPNSSPTSRSPVGRVRVLTFAVRVRRVVKAIPRGATKTYAQVAALAGRPRAYRAVGNILNKNFDPAVPCHRVVRSDGTPGGYNRGQKEKIALLKKEAGALFYAGNRISWKKI